jgi:tetratricopeptide (TPR) repeat protein
MKRLLLALFCASLAMTPAVHARAALSPGEVVNPAMPEIDASIARLGDANVAVRTLAVDALAGTAADAFSALDARLSRTPEAGPGPMWLVLDKVKKANTEKTDDTAKSVDDLMHAVVAAGNSPGHKSLALLLAGIRASEKQGGVAGARVLVRIATDHKGLLKSYASGALKRMGDHAVAALVEVRRDTDKELRGFANKLLDSMGKFLPQDAVQVHDPQALADVITAFGKTKDPDAMRAIIPYLNADRAPVREAARWAIAQYGNDARPILEETYDQFTGDKAPKDWPADKILKGLIVAYDRVRLAEVFKLLDEGIAHRDAGRLEEAVASFDALLARAPQFDRRAELAPAYHELARKKESSDRAAARLLYGKAARLAAGTPIAATIEADLAVLDTEDLLARGIADTSLLQKALAVDPNHTRARDLLQKIENDARAREDRFRRFALAGFAGVVATIAAVLFLGRKSASPPPSPRRPIRI